jgi:hypothetical protein
VCLSYGLSATSTCADLGSDPANCGACGNVCPVNQACSSGFCVATCH